MKFLILFLVGFAVFFSGCSSKKPAPPRVMAYGTTMDSTLNDGSISSVLVAGIYSKAWSSKGEVENIAIAMKKAAKILDQNNIKYFILNKQLGAPIMITNFEDLIQYCHPKKQGLEDKCRFKRKGRDYYMYTWLQLIKKQKSLYMPVWSVKQVLNDKTLQQYINNAQKKKENKDIVFFHNQDVAYEVVSMSQTPVNITAEIKDKKILEVDNLK